MEPGKTMIINRFVVLAAALAGMLLFPNAYSDTKVYKWTDASGEVHYGEMPPDPKNAKVINVHTGTAHDQETGDTSTAPSDATKPKAAEDQPAKVMKENKKVVEENCKIYKQNLSTLQNTARIREQDDKGNFHFLSTKDKEERIKTAEKYIKENCK